MNLNVHGRNESPSATFVEQPLAGGAVTNQLPKGFGMGPAEIDLMRLNSGDVKVQRLLEGFGGVSGRYGERVGVVSAVPTPGVDGNFDRFEEMVHEAFFDHPDNYWNPDVASAYGSPPDLHGLVSFGINPFGQPKYRQVLPTASFKTRQGSVYGLDLSLFSPRGEIGPGARDSIFSIAELERILRQYDDDARRLPSRLFQLAPGLYKYSTQITTENYDLPVPNVSSTDDLRGDGLHFPQNYAALLTTRLNVGIVNQLKDNLSPDLMMGLRMDLNRPFGNGLDDDGNGVVDDPLESLSDEQLFGVPSGIPFDHNNDGNVENDLARQTFARHLYVMMMTLKDADTNIDFDSGIHPEAPDPNLETAIGLAQWAVNVVDFRDSDSIMTAFEFDVNPFNGWVVDGDLSTDEGEERFVVWGCERPELLITETLATHDRNTEDTNEEPSGKTTSDPTEPDDDFDQKSRPKGSCFIELYNPSAGDGRPPAEFYYNHVAGTWTNGIILNKKAPGTNSPIWRLIIVKGDGKDLDPDIDDDRFVDKMDSDDIERAVYFTDTAPMIGDGVVEYFTSEPVFPIAPGRFAVLGSGERVNNNLPYTTYFGERSDAPDPATTRRIELDPTLDPNNGNSNDTVVVASNDNNKSVSWTASHRPVAIVIDGSDQANPRFNVSEPLGGYPPLTDPVNLVYTPPLDEPRDLGKHRPNLGITDQDALMKDGIVEKFRTVQLQRLANPLLPYDATSNPYRTVDSAFINLVSFNGRTSSVTNPDPAFPNNHPDDDRFITFQRGDFDNGGNQLWPSEIERVWRAGVDPLVPTYIKDDLGTDIDFTGNGDHYFDFDLVHTLGYLNRAYGPPGTDPVSGNPWEAPSGTPFPWLTWLNRPFVSQYELMQVPKTSSSRLLAMFSIANSGNPYNVAAADTDHAPFGHLLNFFQSHEDANAASQLFRIFEYTHVPSKFVTTSYELDPGVFTGGSADPMDGRNHFHPPFHRISRFRDPGKVNLNTVFTHIVWNAIRDDVQGPSFDQIVTSRRGYGTDSHAMLRLHHGIPTFFANPIRPPGTGKLAPTLTSTLAPRDDYLEAPEVGVTMMRPAGTLEDMDNMDDIASLSLQPLFVNSSTNAHDNTDRNSYFRYQGLQRMANLVTNRSNVFAIWITVGYFEMLPHPSTNLPSLGSELGSETGEIKRHRGFYVVDRSIPVAFQPGHNHNMERAVLLRRFIE